MKRTLRKAAILFGGVAIVAYLIFRATTFNYASPLAILLSALVYSAEIFAAASMLLFFKDVWDPIEPAAQPPLEGATIDVLVTTYDEDAQLLRATLAACVRMRLPHKTWVLDDGGRAEIKSLAAELGVEYVARGLRTDGKAGNLNYALRRTQGEFIVTLDADQVPEPQFLERLIGHFRDPKLAFVQTPHAYYNLQSFPSIVDFETRTYWNDRQVFFGVVQPGKNRWNAASYCGSAAMLRRTALEEIGGVATETAAEDFHTGLRMHARGWKSLYVNERLIVGQGAPDVSAFHEQRLKRGEGALAMLAFDDPLTMRGLTPAQRLSYASTLAHWCGGLARAAFYATPLLMLFTGVAPAAEVGLGLLAAVAGCLATTILVAKFVANGHGSALATEMYGMAAFWNQCRAVLRAMTARKPLHRYQAARREAAEKSAWKHIAPQAILLVLTALALAWAWMRNSLGLSDAWLAAGAATAWALFNAGMAAAAIRRAMAVENQRFAYRHAAFLPVKYSFRRWDHAKLDGLGITADLNEQGLSLISYQALPVGQIGEVEICGPGESVRCRAEIRALIKQAGRREGTATEPAYFRYGVQFIDPCKEASDSLARLGLQYAAPQALRYFGAKLPAWKKMLLAARRRRRARREFRLPLELTIEGSDALLAATEDLSPVAFRTMLRGQIGAGVGATFMMATPFGAIRGAAKTLRSESTPIGGRTHYATAFEMTKLAGRGETILQALLAPTTRRRPVSEGLRPTFESPRTGAWRALAAGLASLALLLPAAGAAFRWFHAPDIFLAQAAASGKPLGPEGMARVDAQLRKATVDPSTSTAVLQRLRDVYLRMNRIAELKSLTEITARRRPADLAAQREWAMALANAGCSAEAEERYAAIFKEGEKAGWSDRERTGAAIERARNLARSRRTDGALPWFAEAIKAAPSDAALRREIVTALVANERRAEALELFGRGPTTTADRRALLAIHEGAKDFAAAERECREILGDDPADAEARRKLPSLLAAQGRAAEAAPLALDLVAAGETGASMRLLAIECLMATRDFTGAELQCRAILAADPGNAKAQRLLPELLLLQGQPKAAKPLIERLSAANPDDAALRWRLVECLLAGEDFGGAETECRRILATRADHPGARRLLPELLAARGEHAEARRLTRLLIAGGDRDPWLPLRAAQFALWQGDGAAALAEFRSLALSDAWKSDPRHEEIERETWRGYLDAVSDQAKLSAEHLAAFDRLAAKLKADAKPDPEMTARLASGYRACGKLEKADQLLESALKARPGDRAIRRQLAETARLRGDGKRAAMIEDSLRAETGSTSAPPTPALSTPIRPRAR